MDIKMDNKMDIKMDIKMATDCDKKMDIKMAIDYDKTSCVDALKLIRLVRNYEIIYNKLHPAYTDTSAKEQFWEDIHRALFGEYEVLNDVSRAKIRKTVRKRWKSLRDSVVKDLRAREIPGYQRKKRNQLLDELQFVVPYVKKHSTDASKKIEYGDEQDGYNQSIDLTSDIDDEMSMNSIYYPSVRLTSGDDECDSASDSFKYAGPNRTSAFAMGHAVAVQSAAAYTVEVMPESPPASEATQSQCKTPDEAGPDRKRKRISTKDYESKVFEFIDKVQTRDEEAHDEDRMFLLSLLTDFKQVLPHKKLRVKSEILAAISNGQY